MANPFRGEAALEAHGKLYTVKFDINALCELEAHFDLPFAEIAKRLDAGERTRMSDLRAVLWGALRAHHPEIGLAAAGDIASAAGLAAVTGAIGAALGAASPEAAEGGETAGGEGDSVARPPRAKGSSRSTG